MGWDIGVALDAAAAKPQAGPVNDLDHPWPLAPVEPPTSQRPRGVLGGLAVMGDVISWCVHAVGCAALGMACWAWWLGDTTAVGDYSTGQVAGCVLTLAVGCSLLAIRIHPVALAVGVTAGFTSAWTHNAAASDPTGLYLVGTGLVAVGTGAGTLLVSFAVWFLTRSARSH